MAEAGSPSIRSRPAATGRSAVALLALFLVAACAPLSVIADIATRSPLGVLQWRRRQRARVFAAAQRADAAQRTQAFGRLRSADLVEYRLGRASRRAS